MSTSRDRVLAELQNLGMSGYEAKAYVALVCAEGALTGYEVAKRSGVPRSTVYETLAKLIARGAAFATQTENGSPSYLPLPPTALLSRLRRDFDRSLESLADGLARLRPTPPSATTHHLGGRTAVRERAQDLIESARVEVYASIWPEDAAELVPALRAAAARGVDISLLSFGEYEQIGNFFLHRFASPEVVLDRVGCRLLVLAADRRRVLIGGEVDEEAWGVYSEDPAVVLVALEYVRHDIAIQILAERVGPERVEEIWYTDPALARVRSGQTWHRPASRSQ
ncbi:MAG TPA: helix-turn-helix domain-containing protein [Candidatus Dormibacteraeota bacterium]|nr:helix-turn-helix domain-containing protein [Candidatus Dormibacteraeota bacterium]